MNEIINTLSSNGTYEEWLEIKNIVDSELLDFPVTCYGIDVDAKNKKMIFETKRDHLTEKQMTLLSFHFPDTVFCLKTKDESGYYGSEQYFCDKELCTQNKTLKNREKALKRENKRFLKANKKGVSQGLVHKAAIMHNGKVATHGMNIFNQCDVFSWENIFKVSCGNCHSVALNKNGELFASGSNANGQCEIKCVSEKAVDISCGRYHTAILLESGKVQVLGSLVNTSTQIPIDNWHSVVKIKSVYDAVIGVTSDNQLLISGFCTLTDEELRKALKIK